MHVSRCMYCTVMSSMLCALYQCIPLCYVQRLSVKRCAFGESLLDISHHFYIISIIIFHVCLIGAVGS